MVEQTDEHRQMLESGAYYDEALKWYSLQYHHPISQRAILIVVTVLCVIITLSALISFFTLLPLREIRPMVVFTEDSLERVASVQPMMDSGFGDPNEAILEWLLADYVNAYEAYDYERQQIFLRRVHAQSERGVYAGLAQQYRTTASPTVKYERHTRRNISVRSVSIKDENRATVRFTATEEGQGGSNSTEWVADIAFRFTGIEVNQRTGAITPMTFQVTNYQSKKSG